MPEDEVRELSDISVQEISLVKLPSNRRKFLLLKSAEGEKNMVEICKSCESGVIRAHICRRCGGDGNQGSAVRKEQCEECLGMGSIPETLCSKCLGSTLVVTSDIPRHDKQTLEAIESYTKEFVRKHELDPKDKMKVYGEIFRDHTFQSLYDLYEKGAFSFLDSLKKSYEIAKAGDVYRQFQKSGGEFIPESYGRPSWERK